MPSHHPAAPSPRRGEPSPLCAHAHAPNRDRHPGNRPRRRSRGWSRDRAAAVGPEHGAGHSFLWPPPAAALEPRWPVAIPIAPPVTTSRRPPLSSPPGPRHGVVDHQGEGGATLEATVAPGPHRSHHHRSTTDRPPPCPGRPWSPARASRPPRRRAAGPFTVPLFRPLEAKSGMGLLPPRYQYAPSGNFFKKSFPGKYPPGDGTQGENFTQENLVG